MTKTITATAQVDGRTYTATLTSDVVEIYNENVWAGTGVWNADAEEIEDCTSTLGDDVYDALSEALAEELA